MKIGYFEAQEIDKKQKKKGFEKLFQRLLEKKEKKSSCFFVDLNFSGKKQQLLWDWSFSFSLIKTFFYRFYYIFVLHFRSNNSGWASNMLEK